MRLTSLSLLAVLLVPLAGCGGSSGLTGSICSTYSCDYDTVTVREVSPSGTMTTIQIDYSTGPVTGSVDRAAVVVCDVSSFVKGQPMPLTDARHIAPDNIDFPTLTSGACTFDTDLTVGADVSGSFWADFTTQEGTVRSLRGTFAGTLEETTI